MPESGSDVDFDQVCEVLLDDKVLEPLYGNESRISFDQFVERFAEGVQWLHSAEDIKQVIQEKQAELKAEGAQ